MLTIKQIVTLFFTEDSKPEGIYNYILLFIQKKDISKERKKKTQIVLSFLFRFSKATFLFVVTRHCDQQEKHWKRKR